ncbi:hypothetical protein A7D00_3818 [Trichophyton violaceum]|uniref:Uncharacterized protein n=1 Tax=Trichophyton violaceum TaxID=34388 RepID=A0A178FI53_TRIVO|nr:hypothetical protein A7D00_3818 [Trichophyton violaceum]
MAKNNEDEAEVIQEAYTTLQNVQQSFKNKRSGLACRVASAQTISKTPASNAAVPASSAPTPIRQRYLVRRTLTSRIPLCTSRVIGEDIPSTQWRIVNSPFTSDGLIRGRLFSKTTKLQSITKCVKIYGLNCFEY